MLSILEDANNDCNEDEQTLHFCNGVYYYLSAMDVLGSAEKVEQYLDVMMDKELVSKIMNIFEEADKVIVKQYPTFKDFINGEMDKECNSAYFRAQESLKEAQLNNPIDQMTLSNYF